MCTNDIDFDQSEPTSAPNDEPTTLTYEIIEEALGKNHERRHIKKCISSSAKTTIGKYVRGRPDFKIK